MHADALRHLNRSLLLANLFDQGGAVGIFTEFD